MVSSPCINVCKMDPAGKFCLGCWRNIEEISAWSRIGDPARLAILSAVARRRQDLGLREGEAGHE